LFLVVGRLSAGACDHEWGDQAPKIANAAGQGDNLSVAPSRWTARSGWNAHGKGLTAMKVERATSSNASDAARRPITSSQCSQSRFDEPSLKVEIPGKKAPKCRPKAVQQKSMAAAHFE
jgi:hypothetical protein